MNFVVKSGVRRQSTHRRCRGQQWTNDFAVM